MQREIVNSSFRVAKRNYILLVHAQKRANVTTYANSDQCRTATTVGGIDIPVETIVVNCPKPIFVFVRAGVKNTAWNWHRSQLPAHSAACAMRICRWTVKMPRLESSRGILENLVLLGFNLQMSDTKLQATSTMKTFKSSEQRFGHVNVAIRNS